MLAARPFLDKKLMEIYEVGQDTNLSNVSTIHRFLQTAVDLILEYVFLNLNARLKCWYRWKKNCCWIIRSKKNSTVHCSLVIDIDRYVVDRIYLPHLVPLLSSLKTILMQSSRLAVKVARMTRHAILASAPAKTEQPTSFMKLTSHNQAKSYEQI